MSKRPVRSRHDYYVYALLRADQQTPFYIGKGRGYRWNSHVSEARLGRAPASRVAAVAEVVAELGFLPKIKLAEGLTEREAFDFEAAAIRDLGRADIGTGILVNQSDGGEGASGHIQTPEDRAKKSAAMNRPEVRAHLSATIRAIAATPEMKAKLSAGQCRARSDPVVVAKLADIRERSLRTPEVQQRRKIAAAAAVKRPEVRAKISAVQQRLAKCPKVRANKSAAAKLACQRPEVRAMKSLASRARWTKYYSNRLLETLVL